MNILLIIPAFFPAVVYGGPIFSTLHTCLNLANIENFRIYVSTTNANSINRLDVETNKWITFEDHFYVKYYNETKIGKFSFSFIFNIWRDIKDADVVHIQSVFSTTTPAALFYAKLFKKPILLSPRGQFGGWCLENGNRFKSQWLRCFIKPLIKKVVWHATSEQEKNEILDIFPNSFVEIIPNGIDYDVFQKSNTLSKSEFVKKFAQKEVDVDKIIVSMGRIQKKKGFDILIDSFSQVLMMYPLSKLFIAGQDEGERNYLEIQIQRLGMIDKVFLIGSISGQDKIDFMANSDLFVLPSHNENFGNVYIESLAAGTPIVASLNTPWQEVERCNCGKWVANTIEDTSKAMLEMLEKDRELMRINSKTLAEKYDWNNIALQFKALFDKSLNV